MYAMNPAASRTIGADSDAVTFTVSYFVTSAERTRWHYQVTDAVGSILDQGTDLSTPDYAEADAALESLISFADAAADPHSGASNYMFADAALAAFSVLGDELAQAGSMLRHPSYR